MKEDIIKVCVASAVLVFCCSVAGGHEVNEGEGKSKSTRIEESSKIAAGACACPCASEKTKNMVVTIKSVQCEEDHNDLDRDNSEDISSEELSGNSPADTYENTDEKKNGNGSGKITVTIGGIKSQEGRIRVILHGLKDDDSDETKVFKQKHLKIDGESVKVSFKDIPAGEYAIYVFHDENKNKKLDKGFFDIPEEGYAFSTNYMDLFDTPEFEDIKFLVEENKVYEDKINLIYNF